MHLILTAREAPCFQFILFHTVDILCVWWSWRNWIW